MTFSSFIFPYCGLLKGAAAASLCELFPFHDVLRIGRNVDIAVLIRENTHPTPSAAIHFAWSTMKNPLYVRPYYYYYYYYY